MVGTAFGCHSVNGVLEVIFSSAKSGFDHFCFLFCEDASVVLSEFSRGTPQLLEPP